MKRHLILLSIDAYPYSGWGSVTHEYACLLQEQGVSFSLLLPRDAKRVMDAPYASCVHYCLPRLPYSFHGPLAIFRVMSIFFPPRVFVPPHSTPLVHSLVDFPYALMARSIARALHCPYLFTAHGTFSVLPFRRFVDALLFRPTYLDAHAIIAISRYTSTRMQASVRRPRAIHVIENPVSFDRWERGEQQPPALFMDASFPFILTVGALKTRKGLDVVIQAFVRVRKVMPDVHLIIVGRGEKAPYMKMIRDVGVSSFVHILSHITFSELNWLYHHARVFALTPRVVRDHFEGYGLIYLEAGACRLPVVASDSGGASQAVVDSETGFVVPEGDFRATADAIIHILEDPTLARRLGEGGYTKAKRQSWEWYGAEVQKVYNRLVP